MPTPGEFDPNVLTTSEKWQLAAIFTATIAISYFSPIDNRTLAVVGVCSGIAVAFETMLTDYYKDKSTTRYQRILAYAVVGAASGVIIDQTLRPKLTPRRPPTPQKIVKTAKKTVR